MGDEKAVGGPANHIQQQQSQQQFVNPATGAAGADIGQFGDRLVDALGGVVEEPSFHPARLFPQRLEIAQWADFGIESRVPRVARDHQLRLAQQRFIEPEARQPLQAVLPRGLLMLRLQPANSLQGANHRQLHRPPGAEHSRRRQQRPQAVVNPQHRRKGGE